jgi:hypothetical protein
MGNDRNYDYYIAELDDNGTMLWEKFYGDKRYNYGFVILLNWMMAISNYRRAP